VADNFNSDNMFRFLDELRENLGKSVESAGDSLNDFEKAVRSATGEKGFRSFNRGLNDLEKAAHSVTDADIKRAAAELKTVRDIQEMSRFIRGLGSTVVSADSGVGKYGQGIMTATDTIGNFAAKMGPLGAVVGEVIKMFGGLAAAGLQQNDELIRNFQSIRDFGVIFDGTADGLANGISGLLDIKNDLGGTNENLVYFGSVLKNIAPDLAGFGGSISQGATNFAKVTGQLFKEANFLDLTNLGYTQQDIIKFGGEFISNQTKYGKIESNNISDTTKRTKDYLETLSELNQLTGMSRDEAAKKMQEQQAALEFQLYLRDKGKTEADAARANMTLVQELFGPTASAAFMKLVANQGVATDELTATYARLFNGIIPDFESTMKEGGGGILQFANLMRKNLSPVLDANLSAYGSTARVNKELGGQLGITTDMLSGANKLLNLQNSDMLIKAKLEEDLRSNDVRIQEAAKIELEQMKARTHKNIAANATVETSMTVISQFINMLDQASWGLAKFIKFVTLGKVDLTDAWRTVNSMDEASQIIEEENDHQKQLNDKAKKLQEEYQAVIEEKTKFEKEHPDKKWLGGGGGYTQVLKEFNDSLASINVDIRDNALELGKSRLVVNKAEEFKKNNIGDKKPETPGSNKDNKNKKPETPEPSGGNRSWTQDPEAGVTRKADAGGDPAPAIIEALDRVWNLSGKNSAAMNYRAMQYTSGVDPLHKDWDSKHNLGFAADFVLKNRYTHDIIPSKMADAFIQDLKKNPEFKNIRIRNEIEEPKDKEEAKHWTAPHIHMELIDPSNSASLYDSKSPVDPSAPKNNDVVDKANKDPEDKQNKNPKPEQRSEIDVNFYNAMVGQLTDMNDKLSRIHNIQEQQLNYAKA